VSNGIGGATSINCGDPRSYGRLYFSNSPDIDRARTTGGHGLGLAIVKTLVEGMGGKIMVRSTLGEGSEFTIVFPT
jgi:signal transduction histidine kinase